MSDVEALLKGARERGLMMTMADGNISHVPFTAHPSQFPRVAYEEARQLQPLFNKLVVTLVRERHLLAHIAAEVSKYDAFIRGLYDIFEQVPPVDRMFGITRSDYMLNGDGRLLQIEMNTISVAFVAFSSHLARLHAEQDLNTETNRALEEIGSAFDEALRLYGMECRRVLMVVRPEEKNTFDQDLLLARLKEQHGIEVTRITLEQASTTVVLGPTRELLVDGHEYGIVYYRSGYTASDYPSASEWKGRLLLESSCALKCPDVGSQLAGMKKTQQVLTDPKILENFLPATECEQMRRCFAGLYSLDSEEVVQMAMSQPTSYVLKPQREGGGNNLYGEDMLSALRSMGADERRAYVLMELIEPIPFNAVFVRDGQTVPCSAVSELGIYGIFIAEKDHLVQNTASGYLLRTKAHGVLEGGVASGFSVLDSLSLK